MRFCISFIFGAVALAGCNDSALDPSDINLAGRYVLELVNREPLPAIDVDNEYFRKTVFADTIEFTGRRLANTTSAVRLLEKQTGETTTTLNRSTAEYRVLEYDRGGIVFEFLCADTAMCASKFIGRLSSRAGTLTTGRDGAMTYRYRRIE